MYEMLMVLGIFGIVMAFTVPLYIIKIKKDERDDYGIYLASVTKALSEYQYQKVVIDFIPTGSRLSWPISLDALMRDYSGIFWTNCSSVQEQEGLCKRPDRIPWSTKKIAYEVESKLENSYALLTISMPPKSTPEYSRWLSSMYRIPDLEILPNGDVRIKVKPLLTAKVYRDLVHRDGSTNLTDDWDVGGKHSIVNAKDFTVLNSDGTHRRLAAGIVSVGTYKNNDYIKKPACPEGLTPDIQVAIKSILTPSVAILSVAQSTAYVEDYYSREWVIKLDYQAKLKDGTVALLHTGDVNATILCIKTT